MRLRLESLQIDIVEAVHFLTSGVKACAIVDHAFVIEQEFDVVRDQEFADAEFLEHAGERDTSFCL